MAFVTLLLTNTIFLSACRFLLHLAPPFSSLPPPRAVLLSPTTDTISEGLWIVKKMYEEEDRDKGTNFCVDEI
ncbi:hypothetical protein P8452_45452 [Trifolium repens]|nr:hypothetical protein P8452_45452 [Trifolium repens]